MTPQDKALKAAVNAIHFGDNSDYLSALHEVVKLLKESETYANESDIEFMFKELNANDQ